LQAFVSKGFDEMDDRFLVLDLDASIAAITDENRPDEDFDWAPIGREIL
jgi:hypothetical protein